MRKTLSSLFFSRPRLAVLVLALSSLSSSVWAIRPVQASEPMNWKYRSEDAALEFQLQAGIQPKYFLLPNPLRLVVDLPNTVSESVEQRLSGDISQIRISEFQPGMTRVVMQLAPNSVLQDQQVALEDLGNGQWQIRPLLESGSVGTNVGTGAIATLPAAPLSPGSDLSAPTPETGNAIELPVLAANSFDDSAPRSTPGLEAPAAATFSTPINSFEPLPQTYATPEVANPFLDSLPTVPADALTAQSRTANRENEPEREPRVPFMVEFGEPLPGISNDFPAAYAPSEPSER